MRHSGVIAASRRFSAGASIPVIESEAQTTGSGQTPPYTAPSGVTAGDYILVALAQYYSVGLSISSTNFTTLATIGASANNVQIWFIGRVATGDSNDNWDVTTDFGTPYWSVISYRISGVDNTTPLNIAGTGAANDTITSLAAPSITTTAANTLAIAGVAVQNGVNSTVSGTGWTEKTDSFSTTISACTATKDMASSGATGDCTFTFGISKYTAAAIQIALNPG